MKFYKSGLDEHGKFSYNRADRSLLVNELYPDKSSDYAVDDGSGWLRDAEDPENGRFCFIPYYGFWMMWGVYGQAHLFCGAKAVEALAQAYMITGKRHYGIAGASLYFRMAQLYPTYDLNPYVKEKCYYMDINPGSAENGRVIGYIADPILLGQYVEYYDMLFDCIDDDFAAYLRENPMRYLGEAPQSGLQVRTVIENNLHHIAFPDYCSRRLESNPGYVQALLLKSAIILERKDLLDEYADYIFTYVDPKITLFTRMDLDSLFLAEIDRDGFPREISADYNSGWLSAFMETARCLKRHKNDLFRHPKFQKLSQMLEQYICADRYTVTLADYGKSGFPEVHMKKEAMIQMFLTYGNPKTARLLAGASKNEPICTDWYLDCGEIDRQIRAAAGEEPYRSESRCFPNFGFAAIESHPDGKDPECSAMYFGSNRGHGHRDTLNLYAYGFGIDMMPDFGTPSYKDANAIRSHWESNMISHNTAVILQKEPLHNERLCSFNINTITGGKLHHYFAGETVSLIDAEASDLYNEPFRRALVVIDLDGRSRYMLDLFEVGGSEQHLSFHAAGTKTLATGAVFCPQKTGTYAGVDIPYADANYDQLRSDGFNYLTDVRRAVIDGAFSIDWTCEDTWHVWEKPRNVHMKIHMLSGAQTAALCSGSPPQTRAGNPNAYTYLIAKHSGGTVQFVSVLEPYEDTSFIAACSHHSHDGVETVTVTHKDGRTDTIVYDRQLRNGLLTVTSVKAGSVPFSFSYGRHAFTGTVVDLTKEQTSDNYVVCRMDSSVTPEDLVSAYMNIETEEKPNAFYEIKSAEYLGDDLWKLGTGDCTFIADYVDRTAKEKGYRYFVKPNASVKIIW